MDFYSLIIHNSWNISANQRMVSAISFLKSLPYKGLFLLFLSMFGATYYVVTILQEVRLGQI